MINNNEEPEPYAGLMVANCKNEISCVEDVISLIFKRDAILFVGNPHKYVYTKEEYQDIIELLIDIFNNYEAIADDIPNKDIYNIAKQIFDELYNYHYADEYLHYKKIELHNGTSPDAQIKRDMKKIEDYKELLLKIYSEYITLFRDGSIYFKRGIPKEAKEQFKALEELKNKITTDGTIENNRYYKPKKPTKKSIKELFDSIEKHYQIKFNSTLLKDLLKQL